MSKALLLREPTKFTRLSIRSGHQPSVAGESVSQVGDPFGGK